MWQVMTGDRVRLSEDLPALELWQGDRGVVREAWYYPNVAFEVEFRMPGQDHLSRVLLFADQIELIEANDEAGNWPTSHRFASLSRP
jgi:hypothetical protein